MTNKTWKEESRRKIIPPEMIGAKADHLRQNNQTIATLNGSFDLLHAGHLQIIYEASLVADKLIVALNTDRSIQEYKSRLRPIIPLEYRLEMMAALEFVDFVTWFDETDPKNILIQIKPNVHVNGAEYGENCIEAETVKRYGGRMHIVQLVPGLSTTTILKKIAHIQSQGES